MNKIENIKFHGASTPNITNYGYNKEFLKQRKNNPSYDLFLNQIKDGLLGLNSSLAIKVIDVISYKGNLSEITISIIPAINSLYNEGKTSIEVIEIIKRGELMC